MLVVSCLVEALDAADGCDVACSEAGAAEGAAGADGSAEAGEAVAGAEAAAGREMAFAKRFAAASAGWPSGVILPSVSSSV